jgi:hypothetical protein
MRISKKEKLYLQDLARKIADIASQPLQQEKIALWKRINALKPAKPPVLIFPGAWEELLPPETFVVQDPFYRLFEADFRKRIYYAEVLLDDCVISDKVYSQIVVKNTGWGIKADIVRSEELQGSSHFEPVIKEEEDIEKIRSPEVSVDWKASAENHDRTMSLFDGILKVEKRGIHSVGFKVMDDFAVWRGFDNLFQDLMERPEWIHRVMRKMTDASIAMFDEYEKLGVLSPNSGTGCAEYWIGSGSLGYTDELPQKGFDPAHVRSRDMWGFATTQIFSLVSPQMHDEFAITYEKEFLSRFGLNCYGCCEPLHRKMDYVKKIPNLRRVSMSPWVDVEEGAAAVGNKYVFSYKPNPALFVAPTWDADAVRKGLTDVLEKTRGCIFELVMKDISTCGNHPERLVEWVRIAKEAVERFV